MTSPSSAPATSACRSRRSSPRPASASCSSTSAARRRRAQPRREPHRGRPLGEAPRARSKRRRSTATTDYDALRDADAIVVALPTPLSKQREPDISIVLERRRARSRRGCAGPARRARVDDVPRDDARGAAADPRGDRAEGRRGLLPRLLARARRPGPHGLDDEERPEDRRRDHRRPAPSAPPRSTGARSTPCTPCLVAGGGRADEAAREHLPLGQHRARQRARAALRPDGDRRLGGRRRGRDEAVRVHALQPGPGLGGHCIPIDPFYLTWKAREFGFYTEFIELAGKVNENMPYYCRSLDLAGAQPRREQVAEGLEACSCSASRTRRTSATCASRRRSS